MNTSYVSIDHWFLKMGNQNLDPQERWVVIGLTMSKLLSLPNNSHSSPSTQHTHKMSKIVHLQLAMKMKLQQLTWALATNLIYIHTNIHYYLTKEVNNYLFNKPTWSWGVSSLCIAQSILELAYTLILPRSTKNN